jgi:hypothetical protein
VGHKNRIHTPLLHQIREEMLLTQGGVIVAAVPTASSAIVSGLIQSKVLTECDAAAATDLPG